MADIFQRVGTGAVDGERMHLWPQFATGSVVGFGRYCGWFWSLLMVGGYYY